MRRYLPFKELCGALFGIFFLAFSQGAMAQAVCPPLESRFGNRDYLHPDNQRYVRTVENAHFNDNVRQLKGGARPSGSLVGDLQYTLNWFPNHHAALDTLVRLAVRERTPTPNGAVAIDCRFEYARRINPRDGMVDVIHAQYRQQIGDARKAKELLERAVSVEPNNANLRYNAGLTYYRLRDFENARENAKIAYALGFPLPGLRNMLSRSGYPLDN